MAQFWNCPIMGQIVKTCLKSYTHGFGAFENVVLLMLKNPTIDLAQANLRYFSLCFFHKSLSTPLKRSAFGKQVYHWKCNRKFSFPMTPHVHLMVSWSVGHSGIITWKSVKLNFHASIWTLVLLAIYYKMHKKTQQRTCRIILLGLGKCWCWE